MELVTDASVEEDEVLEIALVKEMDGVRPDHPRLNADLPMRFQQVLQALRVGRVLRQQEEPADSDAPLDRPALPVQVSEAQVSRPELTFVDKPAIPIERRHAGRVDACCRGFGQSQ